MKSQAPVRSSPSTRAPACVAALALGGALVAASPARADDPIILEYSSTRAARHLARLRGATMTPVFELPLACAEALGTAELDRLGERLSADFPC